MSAVSSNPTFCAEMLGWRHSVRKRSTKSSAWASTYAKTGSSVARSASRSEADIQRRMLRVFGPVSGDARGPHGEIGGADRMLAQHARIGVLPAADVDQILLTR